MSLVERHYCKVKMETHAGSRTTHATRDKFVEYHCFTVTNLSEFVFCQMEIRTELVSFKRSGPLILLNLIPVQ